MVHQSSLWLWDEGRKKKSSCDINSTTAIPTSRVLQTSLLSPKKEMSFGIHNPIKGDLGQMVQHVQNDKGDALS